MQGSPELQAVMPSAPLRSLAGPVAYVLLWFPERTQTFIWDEVHTLASLGLDVRVFTLYGVQGGGAVAAPKVPVERLGLASLPGICQGVLKIRPTLAPGAWRFLRQVMLRRWRSLETAAEACFAALAGAHLARRFGALNISHIHAPWANGPATAAWVASRLTGVPFSFTARAHDIHPPDGALGEKFREAAFVRVNTAANLAYLATLAPQAASRLILLRNGVPLPVASEIAPPPPGPPFHLLSVGRLVEKKGYPILLQAMHRLTQEGLDVRLTLAGDGAQGPRLKRLARGLGLAGRVVFAGFVPHAQVSRLLARAHLFVLPCRVAASGDRDGIPNAILEAMAHGVPVVSTAVGGIPEVVRPGETGWLAPPGDPGALAHCLREALTRPAEARQRGEAGRALVAREFDSRTNYSRLLDLFRPGAAGRHGGNPPCPG